MAGNFSILTALFFPIPLLFYQSLFFKALLDQKKGVKTTWKGRTID
jgi:4,4'-diaponeurosporenoate glycosyltransferase